MEHRAAWAFFRLIIIAKTLQIIWWAGKPNNVRKFSTSEENPDLN